MSYKMYCDGCHLKEFSVAGVGGYLLKDEETIFEFSEQIEDKKKHNIHERFALKILLEKALSCGIEKEKVELFSDDQGLMKLLSTNLRRNYIEDGNLLEEICNLCDMFENITFNYIPREENKRADSLSRQKINENIFKDNQITENGFIHPKWISKNNYSKNNSIIFDMEKKKIIDYLVVHFHSDVEKNFMKLDFYYAVKENEEISYSVQESIKFHNKGWQKICFNNIAKHLDIVSEKKANIGLVIHDEIIVLDQLLRGRKEISLKMKVHFDNLIKSLEKIDKVIVHRDSLVYEKIFQEDPQKMISKKNKP